MAKTKIKYKRNPKTRFRGKARLETITTVQLEFKRNTWTKKMSAEFRERLAGVGKMIRAFLRRKFEEPKTGRTYFYPFHGGLHVASAPDEYPAMKTGMLHKSIKYATAFSPTGPVLWVGVGHDEVRPYAEKLEDPTSKIARPLIRRAFIELEKEIKAELKKAYRI